MDIDVICKLFNNKYLSKTYIYNKLHMKGIYNNKTYKYPFDKTWDENTTNQEIFDFVQDSSKSYRDKHIIVFGYSGSGKTYTISHILKDIINDLNKENNTYHVTCIQIYNNNIYDIFNKNEKLQFFKNNDLIIRGMKKINSKPFEFIFHTIQENRKINKTFNNDTSSRSCMIIQIKSLKGNTTIIDMPGQEVGNTKNNFSVHQEAKNINLNLLALKNCISCYYQKKEYIPFRNSLLTLALKKMFYSVCKVFFICNVNGKHPFYHQLDSMKYASCLVNKKKELGINYQQLLLEYSLYIQNIGLNYIDDNDLFKEIKNKKYHNIHNIKKLVKSSSDSLIRFKKKLDNIIP